MQRLIPRNKNVSARYEHAVLHESEVCQCYVAYGVIKFTLYMASQIDLMPRMFACKIRVLQQQRTACR